ncbi:MAG: four helix bundle protein [Anaerolineae bacterium]|nr:four helix bundle protein [Anaerolineae bacterium]
MKIKSFRDLRVWQSAMDLVEHIYRVMELFPTSEVYGLTNQMRRAAVSIPSNIAEGHTRGHTSEYLQFLSVAQSSLADLQTQIEIALRLKYTTPDQAQPILELAQSLSKQLYALRNSLKNKRPNHG